MLRADHLDRGAVGVELLEPCLGHPSDLDQGGVEHQGVVGRGEDEPVVVGGVRSVVLTAAEELRPGCARDATERARFQRRGARAQAQHPGVEHGEDLRGRAGLAHVTAVIPQHVVEDALADPVGHLLGLLHPGRGGPGVGHVEVPFRSPVEATVPSAVPSAVAIDVS